jgi:hypothetical protein
MFTMGWAHTCKQMAAGTRGDMETETSPWTWTIGGLFLQDRLWTTTSRGLEEQKGLRFPRSPDRRRERVKDRFR